MTARQQSTRFARTLLPGFLALSLALSCFGVAAAEVYVVQPGDTLYDIGLQFGVEPDDLARANGIRDPSGLQIGQRLTIPGGTGLAPAAYAASAPPRTYTVAPGDTLGEIADRFDVSLSALLAANAGVNPAHLQIGQQLAIPAGSGTAAPPPSAAPTGYVVAGGDTLSEIAEQFGVTAHALVAVNDLRSPDALYVGQQLVIPARAELSGRGGSRMSFVWPAIGEITAAFGEPGPYWVGGYHQGLDIGADHGSVIRAAEQGLVIEAEAGWNRGYGTYVKIDHGNGLHTLYAHLSRLDVEPWEEVKRGQVIGLVGSTGATTGPHLHFEVRVDGVKKEPLLYLP